MPKQKFRSTDEAIIIPPKIDLDKRLDPAFAPELSQAINELNKAINELIFRTRNALISHYNSERDMRHEILEERKKNDKLEVLVEILRKQPPHQKRKSSLKIRNKKKLR
jgi:hypothetical protein